jgi:hypothetical protein
MKLEAHKALVRRRGSDRSVDSLFVRAKEKCGQVSVEQPICGIVFSFPEAVWPKSPDKQLAWVKRLTPWWDMDAPDWSPQAQRLRESCVKAINNLAGIQTEREGARVPKATPDTDGVARLETGRSADAAESPNNA